MAFELPAHLCHRFALNLAWRLTVVGDDTSHQPLQAIMEALKEVYAIGCSGLDFVVVNRPLQIFQLAAEETCLLHDGFIRGLHFLSLTLTAEQLLQRRKL